MHYRTLGRSGLEVSTLCLGPMMFGDRTALADSKEIIAHARDAGVNFIDTADQYSTGGSELQLGEALKGERQRWILASKLGNPMGKGPNQSGYSRTWMMQAIDASLKRLNTDYLDLYYLHLDIPSFDLESTVTTLGHMLATGRIRHWGVSNFRGWRIAEIVHIARALGVPGPVACQPYYNAFNRMPEVEILPACAHYGMGVVPYSPVARGVLTGKYLPGSTPPEDSRAGRGDKRMMETEFRPESLVLAQQVKAHAEARGMSATQFAYQWVLANKTVSSVIAGPRTLAQWSEYVAGIDLKLNAEDEAFVDSLVRPGHPSTPGYNDPRYPFMGR